MKKINTKIGDLFVVRIDEKHKKYFQLIAFDLTQLNSDVIRVFKKVYSDNDNISKLEIVKGEVEFYAHCITKLGLKMDYWEKVENIKDIGSLNDILFRGTNDYGSKPGEQIEISDRWYVWRINDADFSRVGTLKGNNRNAEIGVVISPDSIVYRMKYGYYDFVYPNFE